MANEFYRIDRPGDIAAWVAGFERMKIERENLQLQIRSYPTNGQFNQWSIQLLMLERLIEVHFDKLYTSAAPDNDIIPTYNQYKFYRDDVLKPKWQSIDGVIYKNQGRPPQFDLSP